MAALANMGWQILLTMGLASIALGVVALVRPGATLRVTGVSFGIHLLVTGVVQLAGAFGTHVPRHLRALHFITCAVSILLGLISFRGTLESTLLLALWIGFGWLLRGPTETAAAASAQEMPARGWHVTFGINGSLAGVVVSIGDAADRLGRHGTQPHRGRPHRPPPGTSSGLQAHPLGRRLRPAHTSPASADGQTHPIGTRVRASTPCWQDTLTPGTTTTR
ncbi:HdeD family acid-resistance protein [Streptomyces sp. NPDC056309]|uniref:HdeD family acid-resistance protein n=1 Tax=unclassified Streptomyces TaxID=2593676 RepID=UPI0035D5BA84